MNDVASEYDRQLGKTADFHAAYRALIAEYRAKLFSIAETGMSGKKVAKGKSADSAITAAVDTTMAWIVDSAKGDCAKMLATKGIKARPQDLPDSAATPWIALYGEAAVRGVRASFAC